MKNSLLWMVLGLLLLGFWWMLGSESGPPNLPLKAAELTATPELTPTPSIRLPQERTPTLERSDSKYEIPLEADGNTPKFFTLLALESNSESPLSDLEVLWVETPWKQYISHEKWDQVLADTGTMGHTNSKGEIRLPWNESNVDFLVRGKGFYARGRRSPKNEHETYTLNLSIDQTVEAQVNHHDGTAAVGFLVTYAQIHGPETSRKRASARTDANGTARIEHMQMHLVGAKPELIQSLIVGLTAPKLPKPVRHLRGPA